MFTEGKKSHMKSLSTAALYPKKQDCVCMTSWESPQRFFSVNLFNTGSAFINKYLRCRLAPVYQVYHKQSGMLEQRLWTRWLVHWLSNWELYLLSWRWLSMKTDTGVFVVQHKCISWTSSLSEIWGCPFMRVVSWCDNPLWQMLVQ